MGNTLITGGSSGIGLAIAEILVRRGERVSLVARDEARLSAAKDRLSSLSEGASQVDVASADVTDGAALEQSVRELEARHGSFDTLVASAGIVTPAQFEHQSAADFDKQMATNFTGVANAVRTVYPQMVRRGGGRIVIVASAAAHVGIPAYAGYCASKSAVNGFASALRLEARPFGISVSIAFPPDTDTPQYVEEMKLRPPESRLFMGDPKPWAVDIVARRIIHGMDLRRREVHFGAALSCLAYLNPLVKPFLEQMYVSRSSRRGGWRRNLV